MRTYAVGAIPLYLINKKTISAVDKKSINLAMTLPYKIPLRERSSRCLTHNLANNGARTAGTTRSSINDLTRSPTLAAMIRPIATPTTLNFTKNATNSSYMIRDT